MKQLILLIYLLVLTLWSTGQQYTTTRNHIVEKIYVEATMTGGGACSVINVTYFDGLNRKLQEIKVGATPDGTGDIILPYVYGRYGCVEKEYLPYVRVPGQGSYDLNAMIIGNWNVYGAGEVSSAFSKLTYDTSPLSRVIEIVGPGKAWHDANKGVTKSYGFNAADEVRCYRVALNGTLMVAGTYSAGSLRKERVTNEDGGVVETFTDGLGRTLLSVQIDGDDRLETYSIYDVFGRLRWVLSPEASFQLGASIDEAVLQELAYRYDYDARGRLIERCLPGCDPVYMIYDKKDRLVMSQDGKQRSENPKKWSYSLYDGKNRLVETGEIILSASLTLAGLRSAVLGNLNYVPAGEKTALHYTQYDNYLPGGNVSVHAFEPASGYSADYYSLVTGLVTSVKTRVLGTGVWLTTTMYYDNRGRVIQTASDNLQGGESRMDVAYDFSGNVVRQRERHQVGSRVDILETINTYDIRGRQLSSTTKLNGQVPATLTNTYDMLGRLIKQKFGNVEETLSYNIRGWLTGKESAPFKMKLRYEKPEGGALAYWNGNISEWEWQQGAGAVLMYGFTYDGVNRLKETVQKQWNDTAWTTLTSDYLEKGITYDRNGNIKTMQRTADGTLVDNLAYIYMGNQLSRLTENVRTVPSGDIYAPGSVAIASYAYDKNGNMIADSRKVLNLTYNVLNLLREVKVGSTIKARYSYLADGTKLRVRDGNDVAGLDYMGSLIYSKNSAGLQLESANFGGGLIRMTGLNNGQQEVSYFLTDHLGSVRVIVDGNGVIKERNDYYPFGARHVRSDYPQLAENYYKYNGKEEQVTGGVDYLDYGWRMYDRGLGRWFGMDLKAEDYLSLSPYHFSGNNPNVYTDKNGMFYDWYRDEKGEMAYNENIHSQKDMDKQKIKGEYLGQTYTEGNNYYSLFGDVEDLTTWRGKLFKKIDEMFINNFRYIKALKNMDLWEQDEPIEKSVNFDVGLKYKRDALKLAEKNIYELDFQGSRAFYFVLENPMDMNGVFDRGNDKFTQNSRFNSVGLTSGYNMYVNQKNTRDSKIIFFVFPTLESKKKFHKKWQAEYEKYK